MDIKSSLIAVCVVGGLLFISTGCQTTTPPPRNIPEESRPDSPAATATLITPDGDKRPKSSLTTGTPQSMMIPAAPTATPTVGPMPIATYDGSPYVSHTIQAGQTLMYIAGLYDISMEELLVLNRLDGPEAIIQIGQSLRIPIKDEMTRAPTETIWPDSEVVYSPAYVDFDVAEFIAEQGGYLAHYTELVDGERLTSAQIVNRVAERFSVGPRILLTVLEHYGGWVTNPYPTEYELTFATGPKNPYSGNLYLMLGWTAKHINAGYYGYKREGFWIYKLADASVALTQEGMNAGTVGMQNILALHSDSDTWSEAISVEGVMADYQTLFGDPADYALDEYVVPSNLQQPPLTLPWQKGQGFYYTSGPHIGYVEGSGWAAIDFGPPDVLGSCFYSAEPNTAVADGTALVAREGEVQLDLDQDGQIQTGWVILYLHVALDFDTPLQAGQVVEEGDVIGYASCEGGEANASHLHIARRYNGEWINAGGPVPLNLSGWVVQPSTTPYEGVMQKGETVRKSCQCWKPEENLIVRED